MRTLLSFYFFWPALLFAQAADSRFTTLAIQHGLSQTSVECIYQDAQGYMWFGTQNGLNKFDGYRFTIYTHLPFDSSSISDNHVISLYQDRSGILWIGTRDGGLNAFDPATEKFSAFLHSDQDPGSIGHNRVNSIREDHEGTLWIGTSHGLDRFDRTTKKFSHYINDPTNPGSLSNNTVWSLFESRNGTLWIGTDGGGLNTFNRESQKFASFRNVRSDAYSISCDRIFNITEDRDGSLWIATPEGLNRLNPKTGLFERFLNDPRDPYSLSHDNVQWVVVDQLGRLWASTFGGGIDCLDPQNPGKFVRFQNDPTNAYSLAGDYTWTIFCDRSAVLWVGTYGYGVSLLNLQAKQFSVRTQSAGGLSHSWVTSIAEGADEKIWIGTFGGGINCLDRRSNSVRSYRLGPKPFGLSNDKIWSVYEDRSGIVWIGTDRNGLDRLDPGTGKVTVFRHDDNDPQTILSDNVYVTREDRHGRLWIGTRRGVSIWDPAQKQFTQLTNVPGDEHSLPDNVVVSLAETPDGMWIGTFGGTCFWNAQTKQITRPISDPRLTASIMAILCTSSNDVWFGTSGNGLVRLKNDSLIFYTETNIVANNVIYGVLQDDHGIFWLSSSHGILRFDAEKRLCIAYDQTDGLVDDEYNQGAYMKTLRGEIFFGGTHGLCSFFPDSVRNNPFLPPIALTSFKVFNQEVKLPGPIGMTKTITLNHSDNVFSLEFSALCYNNTLKNQYAYLLEGFDRDWNNVGQRRFAAYTNLDPGEYLFRVKGTNNDGLWNETGASVRIIVRPPFWETWWFRLALILAFGSLLWMLYNYRVQRLLEIERLRTRIAGDLHDDVGATLTKIALYSELIRTGVDLTNHDSFLRNISAMSRDVITTMSDIVWSIDARNDNSENLIVRMRDFAYGLLTPKSITVKFTVEGVEPQELSSEFRQSMYLIFKESINNIAKHAEASDVRIELRRQKHHLVLSIHDNGKGFDTAASFGGHGLKNLSMRAHQIGGSVKIQSEEGTQVELTVPWKTVPQIGLTFR